MQQVAAAATPVPTVTTIPATTAPTEPTPTPAVTASGGFLPLKTTQRQPVGSRIAAVMQPQQQFQPGVYQGQVPVDQVGVGVRVCQQCGAVDGML